MKLLYTILSVFICCITYAQLSVQVYLDGSLEETHEFENDVQISRFIHSYKIELINAGYYFAGVDSVINNQSAYTYYLQRGEKYRSIKIGNYPAREPQKLINGILREYANNGYPFVRFDLMPISSDKKVISGALLIDKGPSIQYDSIILLSDIKTKRSYLGNILDIVKGDAFNESNFKSIDRKLSRSPFLTLNNKPDVSFSDNGADIYLDINEKKSSQFSGIIGLQQNASSGAVLVGDLSLNLQNLFKSGKQFVFEWNRYDEESQELNLTYKHPFFLGTSIHPSFGFDLLKQDTVFLNNSIQLGVSSFIGKSTNFSFLFKQKTGNLLTTDLETIISQNIVDYKITEYEILTSNINGTEIVELGNWTNWELSIGFGFKELAKNANIPELFYDTITPTTNLYRIKSVFKFQNIISGNLAVFSSTNVGLYDNEEIFNNELFRIGGLKSVRGFNEKQFFARQYFYNQFELRLFFESRSYLFLLYDQLYYKNEGISDIPLGVGIGLSLNTIGGIFNFIIASGKSDETNLNFTNAKIHFGYTSIF